MLRYKQYPDKRGIVQKKCECKPDFAFTFPLKKVVWKPGARMRPIKYNMASSAER